MQRPQADGPAAGVGVCYVRDENGKLVKKRITADDIYVTDENGQLVPYAPPGPRPFTREDQERCDRTRDRRHTRSWYDRQLERIVEGELVLTKAQREALFALGRSKGWHRRSSAKR